MSCYKIDINIMKNTPVRTEIQKIENIESVESDSIFYCDIEYAHKNKGVIFSNDNIRILIIEISDITDHKVLGDFVGRGKFVLFLFSYLLKPGEDLFLIPSLSVKFSKMLFDKSDIKVFNEKLEIIMISERKITCIDLRSNTCRGEFEDCSKTCLIKNSVFNNSLTGKYEVSGKSFVRIYVKRLDSKLSGISKDLFIECSQEISPLFFECDDPRKITADISSFLYYSVNKRDYITKISDYMKKVFSFRSIDFIDIGKIDNIPVESDNEKYEEIHFDIFFQEKKFGFFRILRDKEIFFDSEIFCGIRNIIFSGLNFFEQQENEKIYHQKIFQQEKMASLGQLYLGITHEINNPNTFIYGNSELIELYLSDIDTENIEKHDLVNKLANIQESVEEIKNGSERISNIVRNLKLLSRFDYSKISEVNLKDVIIDAITVTNYNIRNNATVEFDYDEKKEYIVCGNYDELLQVFINTILNSSQSFDEKRKLKDLRRFQGRINIRLEKRENEIIISIKDNGIGIEKEKLKKVFDPFFTTKSNTGTGLGLNIVYSIIRKFGGEIRVDSVFMDFFELTIELPSE